MTIPWIRFGFKHPEKKVLGLNQTPKSLITLLLIETAFFILLLLLLPKPDINIGGQGDFGWTYFYIYEKGIFPIIGLIEINDKLFHKLGTYPIFFFISALFMDYLILKFISPQYIKPRQNGANNKKVD